MALTEQIDSFTNQWSKEHSALYNNSNLDYETQKPLHQKIDNRLREQLIQFKEANEGTEGYTEHIQGRVNFWLDATK